MDTSTFVNTSSVDPPNTSMSGAVNNSSVTTSPAYTELLETISSLQLDLQKTVSLASRLKSENTAIRKNYDELKVALVRTRQRYNSTRQSLKPPQETTDPGNPIREN